MKLLLIVILFAPLMAVGQKDSLILGSIDSLSRTLSILSGKNGMSFSTNNDYIVFWDDSTMEINGDSAKAIKYLFDYIQSMSIRYWAAKVVLDHLNLKYLTEILKSSSFKGAVKYYNKVEAEEKKKRGYKP